MRSIRLTPIGVIHSPFAEAAGTPVQAAAAPGIEGSVEVLAPYVAGLKDLEGFSHLVLLYYFHRAGPASLEVVPFLDDRVHGVFATRAAARPNPIGMSVVRLLGIEGAVLRICDLDMLEGTPLLDIKPYVPAFDHRVDTSTGWLQGRTARMIGAADDGRFAG
jgi:tRNA-Thr(GGU) m(6)t(6)A37 methyltransferase TsaA